jgi:DNA-binding NarL/FixJ family response regulator
VGRYTPVCALLIVGDVQRARPCKAARRQAFSSDGRLSDPLSGQGASEGVGTSLAIERTIANPHTSRQRVIRVVLADDSFLAREGLTHVLGSIDDVDLVGACADLDELRATVEDVKPDVVLTDIRMPPTNTDEGIRYAGELRTSRPEVGVVVLSQHAEPAYALSLFEDGSSRRAYLLKERVKDRDELGRALREVVAGRSFVDSRIVDQLVSNQRSDPGIEQLTPREREILALIAEGRSNTSIADSLGITKRAVERHINGIFAKLGLPEDGDVNRRVKATLLYLLGEGP